MVVINQSTNLLLQIKYQKQSFMRVRLSSKMSYLLNWKKCLHNCCIYLQNKSTFKGTIITQLMKCSSYQLKKFLNRIYKLHHKISPQTKRYMVCLLSLNHKMKQKKKQQLETSIQKRISSQNSSSRMRINQKMQDINRRADGNKQSSRVLQKELERPPNLNQQKQINREVKNEKKILSSSVILRNHEETSTNRSHKNASFYRSINSKNNVQQKTEDQEKKNMNDAIRKFSYIPLNNQQTNLASIIAKGKTIAQIRQVFK